jgi:sugar phosphate isomerase/epimerase
VDSYHFWLEKEPLKNLEAAMPFIKHVHLADEHGRTSPGLSGQSDYKPFFSVLKAGGYAGGISVEASDGSKIVGREAEILKYVQDNWEAA